VGRVLNQKYRLISQIAEGGMALVYKAEHIFLDDLCAVKIIKKGLSSKEEMLKRFQREAKLTRQVSRRSPFIISIYDFGMEDELGFFYVMELLDGYPFTEVLQDPGKPPAALRAVRLTCQICEALAVVHEEGLVHRDIKPDNIFLHKEKDKEEEMVKLLDFGIARPTAAKATMLTNYGRVMGTPEYMSPEQCRGPTPQQYERGESHLDGRSDIYSLGVLLYQCLTGDVPFPMPIDGGPMAIHKVMAGHVMEEPTSPNDKRPDLMIPAGLSEVTLRAMAKAPDDRFQTMIEFRDALLNVFPELKSEFSGASDSPGTHLDTLPLADDMPPNSPELMPSTPAAVSAPAQPQAEPQPAMAPGGLPGGGMLDRTAIDVQLSPELLEAANQWAQQHAPDAANTPNGGVMLREGQQSPSEQWGQVSDKASDANIQHHGGGMMEELSKTVAEPLSADMMDEIRERARAVANRSDDLSDANPHAGPAIASNKDRPGVPYKNRISGAAKSGKKKSNIALIAAIVAPVVLAILILVIHFFIKKLW
jgi:serine/threonine-protein kinase